MERATIGRARGTGPTVYDAGLQNPKSGFDSLVPRSPAMPPDSKILTALYEGKPAPDADDGELDLFEAAALDRPQRVGDILAADPAAARGQGTDGFTALHLTAFFGGGAETARALIDAGQTRAPSPSTTCASLP